MTEETKIIDWSEMMTKFAVHQGTIVDFCKENNLKPYQLYHQRNKLKENKKQKQLFHEIDIQNNDSEINMKDVIQTIKIEIGNATIYIPAADNNSLLNIIRELSKSC